MSAIISLYAFGVCLPEMSKTMERWNGEWQTADEMSSSRSRTLHKSGGHKRSVKYVHTYIHTFYIDIYIHFTYIIHTFYMHTYILYIVHATYIHYQKKPPDK